MMINPIFDGKRYILDNQMLRVIRALPNVDIFKNDFVLKSIITYFFYTSAVEFFPNR